MTEPLDLDAIKTRNDIVWSDDFRYWDDSNAERDALSATASDVPALLVELAEANRKLAEVEALLPIKPKPLYDGENFIGFDGGPEHRTVGSHRAWSYDHSEWCYPSTPCDGCEQPIYPSDLRDALADPPTGQETP